MEQRITSLPETVIEAEWLSQTHPQMGKDIEENCLLESASRAVVSWAIEKFPEFDHNDVFLTLCQRGFLEEAQKLVQTYPDVDVNICGDGLFRYACRYGHLNVAKWLAASYKIDVNNGEEYGDGAFISACRNGHLEVAKWIVETFPDLQLKKENEESIENVFTDCCFYKRLEVCSWLLEKYDIDIESIFLDLCQGGDLEMVKWLLEKGVKVDVEKAQKSGYTNFGVACWLKQYTSGTSR